MNGRTAWASVPEPIRRTLGRAPQSTAARNASRVLTRRTLRVLGFHGVAHLDHFDRLLTAICRDYTPVDAAMARSAVEGRATLPDHPVWFTFDDGLASTFDAGEVLQQHGIRATAYVCPATVGTTDRLWFQTVASASAVGLLPAEHGATTTTSLKTVPDPERREVVAELEEQLRGAGAPPPAAVTVDALHAWVAQGHEIGNHTWDHPCLDTCPAAEQRRQIERAHHALAGWGLTPTTFAYPNGNHTAVSEAVIRDLGYESAVLFDHRLARPGNPLRISRLRLDSDADTRRALSILSGAHSIALRTVTR